MHLTPDEKKQLEASPVYRYYASIDWSTVTATAIIAHLDAIPKVNVENLPLIKFLTTILQAKENEELSNLSTIDSDTGAMKTSNTNRENMLAYQIGYPALGQLLNASYGVYETEVTLSSGSVANAVLYAAHATKKCGISWLSINADTVPATAYVVDVHEASGAIKRLYTVVPGDMGRVYSCHFVTSTTNTAIQCSISGGAGAEKVQICYCGGQSA